MCESCIAGADAADGFASQKRRERTAPHARWRLRTLVIGLGSDIRADDGVGLHVVRELKIRLGQGDVDIIEIGTAGLSILDYVCGYDRLVLVDAIISGADPGTVHKLRGKDVARTSHLGPGHDADLPTVLSLGEKLAAGQMPREVIVVAIEAADVVSVSTELSPQVRDAVPDAIAEVENICATGYATEA